MATELDKQKKRIGSIRRGVDRAIGEVDRLVASLVNGDTGDLVKEKTKLDKYCGDYEKLSEKILELTTDDTEYDTHLAHHEQLLENILDRIGKVNGILAGGNGAQGNQAAAFGTQGPRSGKPKLPKLEITKYGGEPLKWMEFWDSFETTIHNNQTLHGIEKFKYLQNYLTGDAQSFITGFPLSNDNYATAIDALRKRFGNKEGIRQAHISDLLSLPVAVRDVREIRKIYDKCESHIRCLVALGLTEDQFGQFFAPILLSKFPLFLQVDLNRANGDEPWTLEQLRKLLASELTARENGLRGFGQQQSPHDKPVESNRQFEHNGGYNRAQDRTSPRSNDNSRQHELPRAYNSVPRQPVRTASAMAVDGGTNERKKHKCAYCEQNHWETQCTNSPSVAERKEMLGRRCYRCLSNEHFMDNCDNIAQCRFCGWDNHHSSLCTKQFPADKRESRRSKFAPRNPAYKQKSQLTVNADLVDSEKEDERTLTAGSEGEYEVDEFDEEDDPPTKGATSVAFFSHGNSGQVGSLHTALASVEGEKVRKRVRILLDNGSTITFITNGLAKKLGARQIGTESMSIAGFEAKTPLKRQYKIYEFKLHTVNGSHITIQAHATESISCPILRYAHDVEANPVLKQVRLADSLCTKSETVEVDLLLGGDYYYDLVGDGQIRRKNGLVLLNSTLGYIVAGRAPRKNTEGNCMFMQAGPAAVSDDLQKLWRLEDIGIKDKPNTTSDEQALAQFNKSVEFDKSENRFMVSWPWNENKTELSDNYPKTYARLASLLRRLQKQPEILQKYAETIEAQKAKGIVEKAPRVPDRPTYYMPHREVLTPEKETTKLRVVYDASCKPSKHELSLNECDLQGPLILEDLCGLLMRFRMHKVGIVSDIEKAFLQVGLHKDQRDVARFLWVKDPSKPLSSQNLDYLRYARVTFGINASPFLLAATIQHLCKMTNTETAQAISENIYVDNVIVGVSKRTEAVKFYSDAKSLFNSASMNLREWYSNDLKFMNSLPNNDRGTSESPKVLGLYWNLKSDTLACPGSKRLNGSDVTKRIVLRAVAQAYDPCGFFAPVTIRGKLLLQELWIDKYEWDTKLSDDKQKRALEVISDLQTIPEKKIQRCIAAATREKVGVSYQLHCFSDASGRGLGVAVYLRQSVGEVTTVHLIFAKGRVAPIKTLKIPQLELLAATLAARIVKFVREQLRVTIETTYIWSDSQCVIHWILGRPVTTIFVKNRVEQIRKLEGVKWRYVPQEFNPADIPSRGLRNSELSRSDIWWYGPAWLQESSQEWPPEIQVHADSPLPLSEDDELLETVAIALPHRDNIIPVDTYSTFTKAVGTTAKVLHAIDRFRKKSVKSEQQYRKLALQLLVREAQMRHKLQPNYKNAVKSLRVYQGADGMSYCAGRLDGESGKDPVLLPNGDPFTFIFIRDMHRKLEHAGVAHVLAELRYEYWVPKARRTIKGVLFKCNLCRRFKGPAYTFQKPLHCLASELNRASHSHSRG